MFDRSDPQVPSCVDHVSTRNLEGVPGAATAGDLGPEGVTFVQAGDSPNANALSVAGHEVGGTAVVFERTIDRDRAGSTAPARR